MADNSGATGILGVLIGAVIVGGLIWFFVGVPGTRGGGGPSVNIEAPVAPAKK